MDFLDQGSCNHGFAHPSRSWNYIVGLPSQILQKFSVKFCLTLLPPLFLPCIPLLLSVESPKLRLLFGYNFCIEYVSQGVQNYSRRAIGSEFFGGRLQSHHHQCELINSCDRRLALSSFP